MADVNTLLDDHVTLRYESVDRLILNGYVARLQTPEGLARFLRGQPGEEIPRYAILGERTAALNRSIERFAERNAIPLVHFDKGQRKEDVARPYLDAAEAEAREGVVLIGIAQERADVFRPPAVRDRVRGRYAVRRTSAFINHVYFYLFDADVGPAFIKLCTYAPWSLRVWCNGHGWARRRLAGRHIGYQSLDNGFARVDDRRALQTACDGFSAAAIERFVRRWLARLPSPLTPADAETGYRYELSVSQLEVSCTEVFDRPLHGRAFFESVVLDQLDLGRPEKLQLLFGHRILRTRAAPFRTRVFGAGAQPSLEVEHRHTKIKQYWKLDRALRTETVINDAYDFGIGRRLVNLAALVAVGRAINARLVALERDAQRCAPAAAAFEALIGPSGPPERRAPGLRFGDPRVVALFGALADFRWAAGDIRSGPLRTLVEHHLGAPYGPRQMAYDLRRLVRKGLLERLPHTFRYRLTEQGRRLILFCAKLYSRIIGRGLGRLDPGQVPNALRHAWQHFEREFDRLVADARLEPVPKVGSSVRISRPEVV
jgi:hypothetical protein